MTYCEFICLEVFLSFLIFLSGMASMLLLCIMATIAQDNDQEK
jgi:hypothetical protein